VSSIHSTLQRSSPTQPLKIPSDLEGLSLDYIDHVVEVVDAFQAVVFYQLLSADSRLGSPLFQNVGFVSGEEAAMTVMDAVDLWTTLEPFAYLDLARAQGGHPPPTPPRHAHFHPYS
jgi:hypothetical protein